MDKFVKGIAFMINFAIKRDKIVDNFPVEVAFTGRLIELQTEDGPQQFGEFARVDGKNQYWMSKSKVNSLIPTELPSVEEW